MKYIFHRSIYFFLFLFFIINPLQSSDNKKLFNNSINKNNNENDPENNVSSEVLITEIKWEENRKSDKKSNSIIWRRFNGSDQTLLNKKLPQTNKNINQDLFSLKSLNRSIVFSENIVGPDISWNVPPGLAWNKKYKFDFTIRGHNTKIPEPKKRNFFGWNDGDAVGLFSYQFLHSDKSSFGINLGIRSLYEGNKYLGGGSSIGEGLSSGFRWDYSLSSTSGIALGAEQFIHFDGNTDTGRNIYFTASKGWWSREVNGLGLFPVYVATAGIGTGRLAVGNIKGLCSDWFGGSGTETRYQRSLCWSPIFSLAGVWNEKFSTYFEYNSRFFLLGSSYKPISKIPLRGNIALILSDHVDNYKLHNFSELNWVFNLSLGF